MSAKMAMTSLLTFIFMFIFLNEISDGDRLQETGSFKNYIVHVSRPEGRVLVEREDLKSWHHSFLPSSVASSDKQSRVIHSYQHVISGFAARLSLEDVRAMEQMDGFISAHPERTYRLQTTHSPSFLGLHQQTGLWKESSFGKGIIIGVLDGGITPAIHPSFSDVGMPPPPAKWKGRCDLNASACNNKLIGARTFNSAAMAQNGDKAEQPIDVDGHGTHTASTAAGAFVNGANVLGTAKGAASGIAPHAHLAIYKVCFGGEVDCPDSDILAGMDAAIEDGVDVLSISIGDLATPFYNDSVAIGSLAAVQKGIFVSCSAGNSGPSPSKLANAFPWVLTVGASTIDRHIVSKAKLGTGQEFEGESVFLNPSTKQLPLVYAGNNGNQETAFCAKGSLNGTVDVEGKIVLCERGGGVGRIAKGEEVKRAGGVGMILMNGEIDAYSTIADFYILPAIHVSYDAGLKIRAYINSTATPTAAISFNGAKIGDPRSPTVASFSSRGPNQESPGILKPDILGPGVSILAAWPFSLDNNTSSESNFNFMSGTSMSCPHLSGVAALLKSSHPNWSPASIKSAIMTTADVVNLKGDPIDDETLRPADVFATGSGHVNPSKANDPGLVYDIHPDEYIPYICGLGFTDKEVGILAHKATKCSEVSSIPEGQLNYPSFSVVLGPTQTFTRTVTNVGDPYSSYVIIVEAPEGVVVSVKPSTLCFSEVNQKKKYSVTFSRTDSGNKTREYGQGFLKWVSDKHSVRSPIAVRSA